MTCYPGKVLPGNKNLTHSVTTHVTHDPLPGKSVTRTQKPDKQCYHPCNPCPVTRDLRYRAGKDNIHASVRASSSLSNPSVPISSRHLCFSRSRHVGEAPVCAPRAPIRFTMTGMAIPSLHGNTVGNSEMAVKHTNVLLPLSKSQKFYSFFPASASAGVGPSFLTPNSLRTHEQSKCKAKKSGH